MPTAQLNIRVPAEYHDLMKGIAAKLRQDEGFGEALGDFIASVASPLSSISGDSIASILVRLESVEAQLANLRQKPARTLPDAMKLTGANNIPAKAEASPEVPKPRQKPRPWTEADNAVLRRLHAEGRTQADAVRELRRSDGVISEKWRALGLPAK